MNFFRKFTKSRAQPPRGSDAPVPFRSTRQYRICMPRMKGHFLAVLVLKKP
jgi:hypothetical protein